jgi:hypothetical protein
MRKKYLIEEINRLNKIIKQYEEKEKKEYGKEIEEIPEMNICYCEFCNSAGFEQSMIEYKRKDYNDEWKICYVCEKCLEKQNVLIDDFVKI